MNIERILAGKRVCVCAGSGGVGKTSTSAAIAAGMAARGKKVAVLTIDPAKRLADSLGLSELDGELRQVDPALFAGHVDEFEGELWAAMLDPKRTFDELIAKHAPDKQTYKRIINNRIYQELSGAVAGSQEYMAMEKLLELHETSGCDLLVLDTPPSRNALDFLDAPRRLARFIEGRSLKMFLGGGRFGMRVAGRGGSMLFGALKKITGVDLLGDLSEFFQSFSSMAGGFSERAQRVEKLLAGRQTTFVLVCTPEHEPVDEAIYFRRKLKEGDLPFGGAIVNKVHRDYRYTRKQLDSSIDDNLAERVRENFENQKLLGKRDSENISHLEQSMSTDRILQVPWFPEDIHSISGLMAMNRHLFEE